MMELIEVIRKQEIEIHKQRTIANKQVKQLKQQAEVWSMLTYRRVVVRLGTSDDFPSVFSKPSEPTELQNQKLIENS